jgi:hypothetical protein
MIKELDDMPEGVVGFEASGMVHADDYRDVVLPALERAGEKGDIRFLLVIPDFKGMTGAAVGQDLKTGFHHFKQWKKVALVTDVSWMAHLTSLFGWMSPGQTRVFAMDERDAALAWVAG